MIHTMSVVIELTYDDENGEYPVPSAREVEKMIARGLYRPAQEMGFDKEMEIEAAHGDLEEAFGMESLEDDDENEIIDITPKKKRKGIR